MDARRSVWRRCPALDVDSKPDESEGLFACVAAWVSDVLKAPPTEDCSAETVGGAPLPLVEPLPLPLPLPLLLLASCAIATVALVRVRGVGRPRAPS